MERPIGTPDDGGGGLAKTPPGARAPVRRARAARAPVPVTTPPPTQPAPTAARPPEPAKPRAPARKGRAATAAPLAPAPVARPAVVPEPPPPPARRSRPARSAPTPPAAPALPATGPQPGNPTRRFIEPYQFDEPQRRRLDAALAAAGLDDGVARAIFIGAIAYELAVLKAALDGAAGTAAPAAAVEPPPAPIAATPFPALAAALESLTAALTNLPAEARNALRDALAATDPFARGYGEAYLGALVLELGRVATASRTCADQAPPRPAALPAPATAPTPRADPARRFIAHAGRVFQESFDAAPSTAPDAPFARALAAIATVTGTPLPTDGATLALALAG